MTPHDSTERLSGVNDVQCDVIVTEGNGVSVIHYFIICYQWLLPLSSYRPIEIVHPRDAVSETLKVSGSTEAIGHHNHIIGWDLLSGAASYCVHTQDICRMNQISLISNVSSFKGCIIKYNPPKCLPQKGIWKGGREGVQTSLALTNL